MSFLSAMLATLALSAPPAAPADAAQSSQPESVAYICSYMRHGRSNADPRSRTDLRLVRRGDQTTSQWTLAWPDRPEVVATGFAASVGIHGSEGLRWQENGAGKRAYVAYSENRLADGATVLWFSLNRPSLWETPGYICQSEPSQTGVER